MSEIFHRHAKDHPQEALVQARRIDEPWIQAQELSWVARFIDSDPVPIELGSDESGHGM
ncbi:MAG: hypothetical protein ACO1QB_14050 [Verrucomicrobiales bacterium]